MPVPKKIPLRKCAATGEMKPKKEMIRIVRSKEGDVSVDPTGKKSGRGTYVTKSKEAVEAAKKKNVLARQLSAEIPSSIYDELLEIIAKDKN
ncbi:MULTISPECIES: RNase P modulator RnpM [Bacillaceae]|uniref:RNA-binding protein n=1 Tax=Domibacillus aminovorans TaxID=29332 RepID=A0A177LBS4_9BACI|nr:MULTISPECIES: YlxR family protein [Bacillaceae]OAH53801.1 RNA-binding protein [Domibacillus aminovorans]OAH62051.1 RNA-binding protein [Domibacillus aminovorans]